MDFVSVSLITILVVIIGGFIYLGRQFHKILLIQRQQYAISKYLQLQLCPKVMVKDQVYGNLPNSQYLDIHMPSSRSDQDVRGPSSRSDQDVRGPSSRSDQDVRGPSNLKVRSRSQSFDHPMIIDSRVSSNISSNQSSPRNSLVITPREDQISSRYTPQLETISSQRDIDKSIGVSRGGSRLGTRGSRIETRGSRIGNGISRTEGSRIHRHKRPKLEVADDIKLQAVVISV